MRSLFLFLVSLYIGVAHADTIPIPSGNPPCAKTKYKIIDLSVPTTKIVTDRNIPGLDAFRSFGVEVIFRYYDLPNETIPGKTLTPVETKAILDKKFKIAVVFQHHNDNPGKFLDPLAGHVDAKRALDLADKNLQPFETAIYFGIDGPEFHLQPLIDKYKTLRGKEDPGYNPAVKNPDSIQYYHNFIAYGPDVFGIQDLSKVKPRMMSAAIKKYFDSIAEEFRRYRESHHKDGYLIGIYCTGFMCSYGKANDLATRFWLSPEQRGLPEYSAFLKDEKLNLVQELKTVCVGWKPRGRSPFEFDFDELNPAHPDFGQWAAQRTVR